MDYLEHLNPQQRAAVEHTEGPSMVIAGAGSGKTRVLTYRIAHLIQKGVDSFQILALTFTNKAAREMKVRIAEIIGESEARNIWMGTFHSVFARILRVEAEKLGYPSNFTIYDTQDSRSVIKQIIKDFNLDDKVYKPNVVQGRISSAKNNLISARAYAQNVDVIAEDRSSGKPRLVEIYSAYEQRCFRASAMDFDDLLFKTNVLFKNHPDVLYKYQHKFKYLLVDEYQDTNYSQYLIVKKLAALNENICVVGDDAQSIYAFRGANIQNILNFKKDYPDCKLFKLEQNYRSTQTIVDAANSIINHNKDQIKKKVWTENPNGDKIKLSRSLSDNEEGRQVAQEVHEVKFTQQAKNEDFAILYRTNAQSRSMEEALRKMNIPYKIFGGLSFYQRKEVKDLLSYFRLVANHNDEEALKRIINYPKRGIGKTSMDQISIVANANNTSLWDVIQHPDKYELKINSGTYSKIKGFGLMLRSFAEQLPHKNAYDLGMEIAKTSGILKELHSDKTPEGVARYDNIQELLNGLKEFTESNEESSLTDFLIDVALLTDADNEKAEDKDKVSLMTIHAAKGLEFPYVFIVGMEENLFPSQLSLNSRSELEEERRLFYVALTRAEKKAYLSYATSRYRWGNLISCEPSRFIKEINEEFLDGNLNFEFTPSFSKAESSSPRTNTVPKPKNLKKVNQINSSSSGVSSTKDISVGTNVMHDKFGKGKVVQLEGSSPNTKATVFFPSVGQKKLLLRFAKLTVVG